MTRRPHHVPLTATVTRNLFDLVSLRSACLPRRKAVSRSRWSRLAVDRGALQRLGRLGSRLQRGLIPAQPRELGVSILLALGLVLGRHARRVRRVRRCSSRLGGALLISR